MRCDDGAGDSITVGDGMLFDFFGRYDRRGDGRQHRYAVERFASSRGINEKLGSPLP